MNNQDWNVFSTEHSVCNWFTIYFKVNCQAFYDFIYLHFVSFYLIIFFFFTHNFCIPSAIDISLQKFFFSLFNGKHFYHLYCNLYSSFNKKKKKHEIQLKFYFILNWKELMHIILSLHTHSKLIYNSNVLSTEWIFFEIIFFSFFSFKMMYSLHIHQIH